MFLPSHLCSTYFSPLPLFAGQPGSVDPGQPLVNTIRSDSALIGGNAILLSRNKNKSIDYKSWTKPLGRCSSVELNTFFWLFVSFSCDCVYVGFLLHVWLTAASSYVCLKAVRNFVNCQVVLSVLHHGYRNQISHLRGSYDDRLLWTADFNPLLKCI